MAEYSVNLPKDLKASLISEFEGTWDSENENEDDTTTNNNSSTTTTTDERRETHGSVSSEPSDTKKTIGSRLKKIVSPEMKLAPRDEGAKGEQAQR